MNPWLLLIAGGFAISLAMLAIFVLQRRLGKASLVDVGWTFGVGVLGVVFCAASPDGNPWRRGVLAALIGIWSLRLGSYVLWRVLTQPEDRRYEALVASWGAQAQARLFRFFQLQALGCVWFAAPLLIAARGRQSWNWGDTLGVVIWLVAQVGQTIADWQLTQFRRRPENAGQVCRVGIWRYSRHPNYFFEWLHWWSYVSFALVAPLGWLTIAGPLGMLYFLLFVTGIPPTEAQALRSRGDDYRDYQRTTSVFVPWWPSQSTVDPPQAEQSAVGEERLTTPVRVWEAKL